MTHAIGADQIAKKIIEHSGQEGTGTAKPQQEVDINDQNRMQEALRQQQGKPPEQATPPVDAPVQQTQVTLPKGGDAILDGMKKMSSNLSNAPGMVQSMAAQNGVSPSETLQVQMQLAESMTKLELAGKVSGTAGKDLDSLLKGS
ncbi:MAG: hypothetical protein R3F37_01955 [Candidatus Competibacteraceae bacterium]